MLFSTQLCAAFWFQCPIVKPVQIRTQMVSPVLDNVKRPGAHPANNVGFSFPDSGYKRKIDALPEHRDSSPVTPS